MVTINSALNGDIRPPVSRSIVLSAAKLGGGCNPTAIKILRELPAADILAGTGDSGVATIVKISENRKI